MLNLIRRRLAAAPAPPRYPRVPDEPPPAFRGMPELIEADCRGDGACAAVCPTAAIQVARAGDGGWTWRLDRAACTGCGLCAEACPFAAIRISGAFELAARSRADLVTSVEFRAPSEGARP